MIYLKNTEQVDYINQLFQLAAKHFQEGRVKVSNEAYYCSNWEKFILIYFIKTDSFELVPENEIKKRFYLANLKIALNEIPLCRIFRFTSLDDWVESNKKFKVLLKIGQFLITIIRIIVLSRELQFQLRSGCQK